MDCQEKSRHAKQGLTQACSRPGLAFDDPITYIDGIHFEQLELL